MYKFLFTLIIFFSIFNPSISLAAQEMVDVSFFGREDCRFCLMEEEFLADLSKERSDFNIVYYDIKNNKESKNLFDELAESKEISKVTPLTLIGGNLIQGFNSPETTGILITNSIDEAKKAPIITVRQVIEGEMGSILGSSSSGCESGSLEVCEVEESFSFKLPILGVVDLQTFSLLSLASILGFVDGFNPCAMWVLVTFLMILLQIGDKKKMWQIAGLFILAESIMYFFILNIWYKTWDFIGLDYIVTPLIGVLAVGGGVYFLYKYFENKQTCDIASMEYQSSVEGRIKKLINSPMTWATTIGVIGIAFSVNIIEFACSIGIPQAFTKILEINSLSFITHQFYIFIYTLFYMVDDFVVFGLALWGFNKIHLSYKYSRLSSLIGGILMLILGIILFTSPDLLVF